jgi:AraC-like DNA-binding protein
MSHIYHRIFEQFRTIGPDQARLSEVRAPSARWLENPGCVFQCKDVVLDSWIRTDGVIEAGLFVTVVLKGAGNPADNTIVVKARRDPMPCADDAPREAITQAASLAFPHASIEKLGFRQEFLQLFPDEDAPSFITSLKAPPRIRAIAIEMISPTIGDRAGQLLLSAQATEILVRVFEAIRQSSRIEPVSDRTHWQMQSVKMAIDADLKRDWRVSELASQAGISRRSFNTHFHRLFGASASDYLRVRRLETARDAIIQSGCSVSEAAYLVGYGNPANFATAFRRHFGYAPSQDRS